ncbi:DUF423 domain-containing protein [Roseiarcus fermentans]|uniref:DUF423 domain-containing protein n=1 Tax=Roseiarcus fermentans TaxID=1473586 RepID=UPI001FDFBDA9|nr:DUF423 domain-containing protein [Roseiarcus fermentans]
MTKELPRAPEAVLNRAPALLAASAALMGAGGVALAALATHRNGGELGRTAALFLLLHAAACLGVAAHARIARSPALVAVGFALAAGATLFAADLATSGFTGERLFPFAAPIGGSTMILAWAALAAVFALAARR